jgi:hypothetical protein
MTLNAWTWTAVPFLRLRLQRALALNRKRPFGWVTCSSVAWCHSLGGPALRFGSCLLLSPHCLRAFVQCVSSGSAGCGSARPVPLFGQSAG